MSGAGRIETVLFYTHKLLKTGWLRVRKSNIMARKKSKQQGAGNKEPVTGEQGSAKSPVSPSDAAGAGGGDAGLERLPRANQVAEMA